MFIQKYTLNEDYFKKIDSRNKAYFLGLMYADGNICEQKNSKKPLIRINLVEGDSKPLEILKEDIEYTGPLNYWVKKPPRQNQKVLCLRSIIIAEDLNKLGCFTRKTNNLSFPNNLPDKYFLDFLRGFFDGDGCIAKVNAKNVAWMIIGLRDLLDIIKNKLEILGFHPYIIEPKEGKYINEDLIFLKITRKKEIFNLMSQWYIDTDLYIDRKYNKWNQFFNIEKLHEYENYWHNGATGKNLFGKYPVVYINDMGEKIIFNSMSHAGDVLGYDKNTIRYYCNKFKKNKKYGKNGPKLCHESDYEE